MRAMSQTTATGLLIDPVFDTFEIILDGLKPRRVIDNVQRHIAVQILAGTAKPLFGQLLIAEHIDCVLKHLRVVEGHSTLLGIEVCWLLNALALNLPGGFAHDAAHDLLRRIQAIRIARYMQFVVAHHVLGHNLSDSHSPCCNGIFHQILWQVFLLQATTLAPKQVSIEVGLARL